MADDFVGQAVAAVYQGGMATFALLASDIVPEQVLKVVQRLDHAKKQVGRLPIQQVPAPRLWAARIMFWPQMPMSMAGEETPRRSSSSRIRVGAP